MNAFAEIYAHSLQPFTPAPGAVYTIDTIAHLAGVPRHLVMLACRHSLIAPQIDPEYGGYRFDAAVLQPLRRIHYLHHTCEINFAGIRIILALMEEIDRLRENQID